MASFQDTQQESHKGLSSSTFFFFWTIKHCIQHFENTVLLFFFLLFEMSKPYNGAALLWWLNIPVPCTSRYLLTFACCPGRCFLHRRITLSAYDTEFFTVLWIWDEAEMSFCIPFLILGVTGSMSSVQFGTSACIEHHNGALSAFFWCPWVLLCNSKKHHTKRLLRDQDFFFCIVFKRACV